MRVRVLVPARLWSRRVKVVAGPAVRVSGKASLLLAVVEPLPGRWRVEPHIVWSTAAPPPEGPLVQVRGRVALVKYDDYHKLKALMARGVEEGVFGYYHIAAWGLPLILPEEAGEPDPRVAARIDELAGAGRLARWLREKLAPHIEVVEV